MSDLPTPRSSTGKEKGVRRFSAAVNSLQNAIPSQYRVPLLVAVLLALVLPVLVMRSPGRAYLGELRPPSCLPGDSVSPPDKRALPIVYFVAGPEGSGHDFWERFFSYLPVNISTELFEPELHLTKDPSQTVLPGCSEDISQLPYSRHVTDFGAEMSIRLAKASKGGEKPALYVRARDPFPMGRLRTPLARPDLVNLALYDGIQYNLKVLALVRNTTKSMIWSISRKFHASDVGLQVRLLEDSLTYMDAQLKTMPCGTYAAINLDLLEEKMEAVAAPLAHYLQIPDVGPKEVLRTLRSAHTAWVSPGIDLSPNFGGEPVDAFFKRRALQWPLLNSCRKTAFFSPGQPDHWPS